MVECEVSHARSTATIGRSARSLHWTTRSRRIKQGTARQGGPAGSQHDAETKPPTTATAKRKAPGAEQIVKGKHQGTHTTAISPGVEDTNQSWRKIPMPPNRSAPPSGRSVIYHP